jgi:two-component system OmpR family sensor kinase
MALEHKNRADHKTVGMKAPTATVVAVEALVVLAATAAGGAALHAVTARGVQPLLDNANPLLAAVTAGMAAAVALLCVVTSCLRADPGMRLASYAWGFYALVVMPLSVLDTVAGVSPVIPGGTAAVAAVFVVLLGLSLSEAGPRWLSAQWALAGSVGITALVVAASVLLPPQVARFFDSHVTTAVLLAGWGLLACAYITQGLRRQSPVWYRMGFGLVLVAAAHVLLLLFAGTAVEFAVLRFIGFAVLLTAMLLHVRAAVAERHAAASEAADQAAAAERSRSQRQHEARNTLATLSSVTTLMAPRPDVEAAGGESISAMIDAEFARLRGLLENTGPDDTATVTVDQVLERLVTLRRAAGARITLDCPAGLIADVPAATLAQVVTNLLANCARHATGAEIYVGATRDGLNCVLEVSDAGPGLAPDAGAAPTTGDGLGLALSDQLVEAVGGSLRLGPTTRFCTGTTALLSLPLAEPQHLSLAEPQHLPLADPPHRLAAVPTQDQIAS